MPSIGNLVQETSTSTGTGNFTLTQSTGKQRFSGDFGTGSGNTFYYFISHQTANEWEVGTGYMSDANTMVRSSVTESSNANALVNFTAGTKDVVNDLPASLQNTINGLITAGTNVTITGSGTPASPYSIAASGGGGGSPGGSSGQIQYNNAGAFGGFGNFNGNTVTLTAGTSATQAAIFKAAASQTEDIVEIQNSSGTMLGGFSKGGGLWVNMDPNAFGSSSIYSALVLGNKTGASAGNGGLYAIARYNKANEPFVALCGYDSGSSRDLYYGGGGWIAPDAMQHVFYCASTYTESFGTGSLTVQLTAAKSKFYNVAEFSSYNNAFEITGSGQNSIVNAYLANTYGEMGCVGTKTNHQFGLYINYQYPSYTLKPSGLSVFADNAASTANTDTRALICCDTSTYKGVAVRAAASQTANLQEWQDSGGSAMALVRPNGAIKPASMSDASAANDSIYYSTTANKLVYKDSGGTVNALY